MVETVRTFDVLNRSKGKEITVELKDDRIFKGKLKAFDGHLNLVLFEACEVIEGKEIETGDMIVRGDAIITIKNI